MLGTHNLRSGGRHAWQLQTSRLALLAAALLGSRPVKDAGTSDLLLDLAAARLLSILLDPHQWKSCPAGGLAQHIQCTCCARGNLRPEAVLRQQARACFDRHMRAPATGLLLSSFWPHIEAFQR